MADTVLTELKIHEFDTVSQFLQHESEVGENDLALTPFMPANLYLFYHHWADHIVNDPSWLRADTFSWQSGDVYQSAYEHLVADFDTATSDSGISFLVCNNYEYYRDVANDHDGQIYPYAWTTKDVSAIDTTLYSDTENPNAGDYVSTSFKQGGVEVQIESVGSGMQIDTIGEITIAYYQAEDGHKICTPDQEPNLIALYESTGVAWYYILDTENKQFKLPRTKYGFVGMRDGVGNYAPESLPNIKGSADFSYGTLWETTFSGSLYNDMGNHGSRAQGESGSSPQSIKIDASLSSPAYQEGAPVQQRATQMYLYFYVGHFEQDSVEQTAGINTETFNGKADRNLMNTTDNVDIVIESQLPTEANGYTWYKKYKSGWVEQGGSPTGNSSTVYTGTLPVEMADTNYTLVIAFNVKSSGTGGYSAGWDTKTTTGFTTRGFGAGSATVNTPNWYACGMSA